MRVFNSRQLWSERVRRLLHGNERRGRNYRGVTVFAPGCRASTHTYLKPAERGETRRGKEADGYEAPFRQLAPGLPACHKVGLCAANTKASVEVPRSEACDLTGVQICSLARTTAKGETNNIAEIIRHVARTSSRRWNA